MAQDVDDRNEPQVERAVRSYVRPMIEWEETLDTRADLALACGKNPTQPFATCNAGNISS